MLRLHKNDCEEDVSNLTLKRQTRVKSKEPKPTSTTLFSNFRVERPASHDRHEWWRLIRELFLFPWDSFSLSLSLWCSWWCIRESFPVDKLIGSWWKSVRLDKDMKYVTSFMSWFSAGNIHKLPSSSQLTLILHWCCLRAHPVSVWTSYCHRLRFISITYREERGQRRSRIEKKIKRDNNHVRQGV